MKHWVLMVLGAVFLLLGWGFASTFLLKHEGEVLVVNETTEQVLKGEVEICDQRFVFQGIDPGGNKLIRYKVTSDSHYKITLEFESGKKLVKEVGYVTNGLDFKDTLVVKDSDVILTRQVP